MDKTAIKNYAIYARNKLIQSTKDKAATIGIYEEKVVAPSSKGQDFEIYTSSIGVNVTLNKEEVTQRENLIKKIHEDGYKETIEEIAYTWFNRIIAIRFMEVNDYLPSRVRVLSSENAGQKESDLMQSPFSVDFAYTQKERDLIISLKDQNKIDELFKVLFIKACNELSNNLPNLFEKTIDYTELLFDIRYNDPNDVIYKLVNEIPESNFNVEQEGQVEIIGWLYQYYNTEPKANIYARPKGKKIEKEDIPAVTQLFTPDWICKYMVENSLGRLWLESHNAPSLKSTYKYYLDEAKQDEDVQKQLDEIRSNRNLKLEDIKLIDPCMGSGHILVYAFDVFIGIYESEGWNSRDAAVSILQKNLYGLDIDKRAYQLSYFALMMKARQYNRWILIPRNEEYRVKPNVFEIKESNNIYRDLLTGTSVNQQAKDDFTSLLNQMHDAKEYGSLLEVKSIDFGNLKQALQNQELAMFDKVIKEDIIPLIDCAKLLSQQYDVVVTNPPYTPISNCSANLQDYVKMNYPDSKTDFCSVFIERCKEYTINNGYQAMITMHSWMFLSSFEKLRNKLINNVTVLNMVHLGTRAFEEIGGEVVQTTSFVIQNESYKDYKSKFKRLVEYKDAKKKEKQFIFDKFYISKIKNYKKTPGCQFAYWVSEKILDLFGKKQDLFETKAGITTGDNEYFIRNWFEIDSTHIYSKKQNIEITPTWYFHHKGGSYRKWYGNIELVLHYDKYSIEEMKKRPGFRHDGKDYYFRECATWNKTSTGNIGVRYSRDGFTFNTAGCCLFTKNKKDLFYSIAVLNSKVMVEILNFMCPTFSFAAGDIAKTPIIRSQWSQLKINYYLKVDSFYINEINIL